MYTKYYALLKPLTIKVEPSAVLVFHQFPDAVSFIVHSLKEYLFSVFLRYEMAGFMMVP